MGEKKVDEDLVAYCGLYCGECGKLKRGRCPGCAGNEKAAWCKIRSCCMEHGYASCAECKDFEDLEDCRKLNNLMAKGFAFIFRSNRIEGLRKIRKASRLEYAREMAELGRMTYSR